MIDTDKYEGHTSGSKSEFHPSGWWAEWKEPCTWYIRDPEVHLVGSEANRLLIQDAPLLLAEVKRLREQGRKLIEAAERVRSDISDQDTGWYYQLGNHIEKMNRLVKE